jgi:hypothetical protein
MESTRYQPSWASDQDRPNASQGEPLLDSSGADAPDAIEITPSMVEAGYAILCSSGIKDEFLEADKLWIAEIYRTMYSLRPEVPSP